MFGRDNNRARNEAADRRSGASVRSLDASEEINDSLAESPPGAGLLLLAIGSAVCFALVASASAPLEISARVSGALCVHVDSSACVHDDSVGGREQISGARVFAFARERMAIDVGAPARLLIDLPPGLGDLRIDGVVQHVDPRPAKPDAMRSLGIEPTAEPRYVIDLAIDDNARKRLAHFRVIAGDPVMVEFPLRSRPILASILDPRGRWLP